MRERGQLVLLAAAALAVALVPMAVAHLQLGYQVDADAAVVDSKPLAETERVLSRAVDDAVRTVPARYNWSERVAATTAVRDRLSSTLTALNRSRLNEGTVSRVSFASTRASEWSDTNCPRRPNRQFGECVADGGVVVQERLGDTHVLAVAFEITITTPRGEWRTVSVVRGLGRPGG